MDPFSSAAPKAIPTSPLPPLLPQIKRRRRALIVSLIVVFVAGVVSLVGLSIGSFFLVRALEQRQPGAAVLLQFDLSKVSAENRADFWQSILKAVNRRAGQLGGCRADEVGPGQIRVRFFGKKVAEIVASGPYLAKSTKLDFRVVYRDGTPETIPLSEAPPGYEPMTLELKGRNGEIRTSELYVNRNPEMTGEALSEAYPMMDEFGRFKIILRFTKEGGKRFADVTRTIAEENKRTGRLGQLAIILDGKLYSAPTVREEIPSGSAEINGSFTQREVEELARMLNNPLPLSATFIFENEDGSKAGLPAPPPVSW